MYPLVFLDMTLLPVIAGLVLGAPLLAQEAESGTVQFAWTQGVSKITLVITKALWAWPSGSRSRRPDSAWNSAGGPGRT